MDFTVKKYKELLESFIHHDYKLMGFKVFLDSKPTGKFIILRHDVDEQPLNALKMATAEKEMGILSTYYFRKVSKSDNPEVIRKIASMGHEIGYHYEDLSSSEGDIDRAIVSFKSNLDYFRQYYPVETVCMHGSSSSKFDNRDIWNHCHLSDFGLIGEPYLSCDFKKIFYMTDTGYAWDGGKYAVRDKVQSTFDVSFHSTDQVIDAINKGIFPEQAMILAHTLWTDSFSKWITLHLRESIRNRIKLLTKKSHLISKLYSKAVKLYWK